MSDCLFCKFANKELETEIVYEDDNVLAFKDINPLAEIHILFINKIHTENISEIMETDPRQVVDIFNAINIYTKKEGLKDYGYRILTNLGENAGQTMFHSHFHVLSGQKL